MAEFEIRVRGEVEAGRTVVSAHADAIASIEERLQAGLEKYAKSHKTPVLAAAKEFYKAQGLAFKYEAAAKLSGDEIEVSYDFYSEMKKGRYHSAPEKVDHWNFVAVVPAKDTSVQQTASELSEAHVAKTAAEDVLKRWLEKLSQMSMVERQARAQLSAAVMKQSANGQQIFEALQSRITKTLLGNMPSVPALPGKQAK